MSKQIAVKFENDEKEILKKVSSSKGLNMASYVRFYALEQLKKDLEVQNAI